MANKKVAFVSGSTRGIGKGIANALIAKGYIVYISGRDQSTLDLVAQELGDDARSLLGDLTQAGQSNEFLDLIIKNEGHLDVVVSNLGDGKSTKGWSIDLKEYQRVFDVNFFSAVELCTAAAEKMTIKGGHIITISSIAGCESLGAPLPYTAAKSALLAFVKSFSDQVSAHNIQVNSVSPGNILFSGSTWDKKLKQDEEGTLDYIKKNVPLNSFGSPDEIAKCVLFLLESTYITGTNLVADGGQLRRLS